MVSVSVPYVREGAFGANFPVVNSDPLPATEGAGGLKKSKRRQERDDEDLVSRVRELVVADVRAEVRAGFESYLEELRTVVREVKVGKEVDDGLVVEGSHRVREKSKRRGKWRQKVGNEGKWIVRNTFYNVLIVV